MVKWIKNCPQCSSRKRKPAEMGAESQLEALSLPHTHDDVDRCVDLGFSRVFDTRHKIKDETGANPMQRGGQKECMYTYA